MKTILRSMIALLLAAVLALGCLPAQADSVKMYVSTGNSGKLNLRTQPTVQSQSLGLYANGTEVTVENTQNGWAYVTVGGMKGYMMLSCLSNTYIVYPGPTAKPWAAATPVPTEDTTLYIQTGNSGKLHLREQPSTSSRSLGLYPNGTAVQVTARVGNFAFVQVAGITGYMMQSFLTANAPAVQPTAQPGVPTAVPFVPGSAAAMYIATGNTGKLHLREQPSTSARSLGLYPNGTAVLAVNLGNGWAQVQVNGRQGYMMLKFLAYVAGVPTPVPTATPDPNATPGPTAVPSADFLMYIATGNTGKLHLRENVSTSSRSLGLYPNGTVVTVHGFIGEWAQVTVAGKNGYMMRKFLAQMPSAVTPTPTPTPTPTAPAPTDTAAPGDPTPTPTPEIEVTPTPTPVAEATPTAPPAAPNTAVVTQPSNSYVNLRSSPQSEAPNVIAQIPSGTVVEVLERGATWCRIRVNGMEGWMISWYLK